MSSIFISMCPAELVCGVQVTSFEEEKTSKSKLKIPPLLGCFIRKLLSSTFASSINSEIKSKVIIHIARVLSSLMLLGSL